MSNELNRTKFALLIDGDNVQPNKIGWLIEFLLKYWGTLPIRRVYGDWTSDALRSWRDVALNHGLEGIQQFRINGKNSTDSALIIDAMDILFSGKVDGFCLVSGDGDYTRLVMRMREEGLFVIGAGTGSSSKTLANTCDEFLYFPTLPDAPPKPQSFYKSQPSHKQPALPPAKVTHTPPTPKSTLPADTQARVNPFDTPTTGTVESGAQGDGRRFGSSSRFGGASSNTTPTTGSSTSRFGGGMPPTPPQEASIATTPPPMPAPPVPEPIVNVATVTSPTSDIIETTVDSLTTPPVSTEAVPGVPQKTKGKSKKITKPRFAKSTTPEPTPITESISVPSVEEIAPEPAPTEGDVALRALLQEAYNTSQHDKEGWTLLSAFGAHLRKLHPDFEAKNYGFKLLSQLIESHPSWFETKRNSKKGPWAVYVRMRK